MTKPGRARRPARGFALFETPIGVCGIAWGERGILGFQLPEYTEARTLARLVRQFPGLDEAAPPPKVKAVQRDVIALLRGQARDLSQVPLDMQGLPPFRRRVYEAAREIPPGATLSYGEIAKRIGAPGSARAVGQALGRNPFAIIVPCHRVLAAGGRIGGFSARGGVSTKQQILAIEGLPATACGQLDFDPRRAVRALRQADPALARSIDAIGPCELARELRQARNVFETLSEAIVAQQLSAKAAATIHGRFRALFPGRGGLSPKRVARVSEDELRAVGLSRAKALALRDLAQRTEAGEIPALAAIRKLSDDEIVERLTRVRGIGRWTAEMFLIFQLGRPDVLAVDDYALRKGFALAMGRGELPSPKAFAAYGERWAPWRSVASWYLWRVAERGQ